MVNQATASSAKVFLIIFLTCIALFFFIVGFSCVNYVHLVLSFKNLFVFTSNTYNPENPPIFFSTGEAISALAILFAVYLFKKDKWSLALKIKNYIIPTVVGVSTLGVGISIFSSLFFLSFFKSPQNIFQLSSFWQVIASLLIIFSIVFLFRKATNKGLFSVRNSRRFYETLHWEISRPTGEGLNLVLNVLLENFENICEFASSKPDSETGKDARAILEVILSDGSIVKLLCTQRLDGLLYIVNVIKKYHINRRHSPKGIPLIMRGLFFNPDSFLYKQLDDSGLALSANLYDNLFGSPEILTNFDLFGYPTISFSARNSTNDATVNVFIQSISRSIETYLKTGKVPARNINRAIEHLSNIFGEICSEINLEKDDPNKKGYGLKSDWWSLHQIAHFFGHDYIYLGKDEELDINITAIEKTAQEANFYSNLTINESIAAALYKGFEQLSHIKKSNDRYHHVLDLLDGIMHEPNLKEGYILPFEKRIWEQIGKNVLGHYYPMVLRSYLDFIGFCLAGDSGQRKGWTGEQAEKMRRLLYIDLKPQLDRNEKMIDGTLIQEALIPDCMDYKDGKFYYTMGFGRGLKVEIIPPPDTSISALSDVNWEHSSSLI